MRKILRRAYSYFAACFVVTGILLSLFFLISHMSNILWIPFWDGLSVYIFLDKNHDGIFEFLWSIFSFIDNEHKAIFPIILWKMGRIIFEESVVISFVFIYVLCFLSSIILASLFFVSKNKIENFSILAAIMAFILSPGHYENLIWWKQLHVYMACALTLAVLYMAARVNDGPKPTHISKIGAIVALALVPPLSFSYGVMVWPLLLGHAIFARWKLSQVALIALGGGVYVAVLWIFPLPPTPHHGSLLDNLLNRPVGILAYASSLMGFGLDPIFRFLFSDSSRIATLVAGALVTVVAVISVLPAYFLRRETSWQLRLAVLICGFSIGNALITGLSRVTVNEPFSPRYLIISTIGLISFAAILFQIVARSGKAHINLRGLSMLISLSILAMSVSFYQRGQHGWEYLNARVAKGAIGADMGIASEARLLYPDEQVVLTTWPSIVAKAHASGRYFGFGHQGVPISKAFKVVKNLCVGHVDSVNPSPKISGLWEIAGWARWKVTGTQAAEFVLIVDAADIVRGVGVVRTPRPDVAAHLKATAWSKVLENANRAGYSGLFKAKTLEGLTVYATTGRDACLIGPISK